MMMGRGRLLTKLAYALTISSVLYFRVHGLIFPFLMSAILLAAFVWGDWEERLVASALVITLEVLAVGPRLHLFAHSFDVEGSRTGVMLVGTTYLAVLLAVAVSSRKWWPSWAAAFQLLLVLGHPLFVLLRDQVQPWAYASGIVIWSWLQLIAISFGIFDAWALRRDLSRAGRAAPTCA